MEDFVLDIVDRIQFIASKQQNFASIERELGLGNGIIGKWRKQSPSCDKISKVANYLDCSVDYLLGRTDNPLAHKEKATYFSVGSADNNSRFIGSNNSDVSIHNISVSSKQAATLLNLFNELDPIKQAKLLVLADELANS